MDDETREACFTISGEAGTPEPVPAGATAVATPDIDYERWDWDFALEMPPADWSSRSQASWTYLGDNPPMRMVFDDDLVPGADESE